LTPEFTKTEIPHTSNLGELLREKREAMGLSIKEVELSIRIRSKYIDCLEKGLFSFLPNDVYVKGFLKNYCEFLQLDYSDVLAIYLKEKDLFHIKPKKTKINRKKVNSNWYLTPKTLIITFVALSAFLVTAFIYWQFMLFTASPLLNIVNPKNNEKIEKNYVYLMGNTNPGVVLFVNEIKVQHKEGSFNQRISLNKGTNIIMVKAVNKLGKSTENIITIFADIPEVNISEVKKEYPLEVKISALDQAISIDVSIDGGVKEHRFLMPKTNEKFVANEKIIITSTDPKNTLVAVSNEKVIDEKVTLEKWNLEDKTLTLDKNW